MVDVRSRADQRHGSHPGIDNDGPDRPPWQKLLWRPQPYPDNYVPPSFLDQLRTNSTVHLPSFLSLSLSSLPIAQHFLGTILFVSFFIHLYTGLLSARSLIVASILLATFAWLLVHLRDYLESDSIRFSRIRTAAPSEQGSARRPTRPRRRPNPLLSFLILSFVLLSLSPVLRTLSEATTSDSIWALAAFLFSLHLVLADYRIVSTPADPLSTGQAKPQTPSVSPQPPPSPHLRETLSLNAAICGSVVLASRLPDDTTVFALLLASILTFALSPRWRRSLLRPPTRSTGKPSPTRSGTAVTLTALLYGATVSSLRCRASSNVPSVLVTGAVTFLSVVAPAWMRWAQRWKWQIEGPWDPAVPVLSSSVSTLL